MTELFIDDTADNDFYYYLDKYLGKKIFVHNLETKPQTYRIIDVCAIDERVYATVEEDKNIRFNLAYIEKYFLFDETETEYIGNKYEFIS